jgi:diguanylate cyclase (GGDEF)-like protein
LVSLDIPTLMVAVTLIFIVCSLSLVAHWLANFDFTGLGRVAAGMTAVTAGFFLLMAPAGLIGGFSLHDYLVLLGDILILLGHLWVWFGIADFWAVRSRRLTYLAGVLMLLACLSMLLNLLEGGSVAYRSGMFSTYIALLSLGALMSLMGALGGRVGLYKGIVKRKTIAAAAATGFFAVHILFHLYRAVVLQSLDDAGYMAETALARQTFIEALVFALAITIAMIVMTTERIQADLKIQAMMDPLTRALNRRAFMTVIKTVLARSRRNSEPVSLIMMDIDKFKRINQEHSHLVGDAILSRFASGVMEGRRAQDVFCRFGGEEFVLLLPDTPEKGARLVAERVRTAVTGTPFRHDGKDISLTVSFGVMTARGEDLLPDSMLDAAYKALRAAQRAGRNHVKVAQDQPVSVAETSAPGPLT